jgi:ribose 5-phosphate isomerase A
MNDPEVSNKRQAAQAALRFLQPDMVLGVGTGSTVNVFIELLAALAPSARPRGAVSSSDGSSARLRAVGIPLLDLNEVASLSLYIDGADEANRHRQLIKGGGGALTREKIVAAAAERFICIIDERKLVDTLGRFPLPIEVIPMARSYVARQLERLGGRPIWRQGFTTDNGNQILDTQGLNLKDPLAMEATLNQITGVVTCGLFAARAADRLLIGARNGVQEV